MEGVKETVYKDMGGRSMKALGEYKLQRFTGNAGKERGTFPRPARHPSNGLKDSSDGHISRAHEETS